MVVNSKTPLLLNNQFLSFVSFVPTKQIITPMTEKYFEQYSVLVYLLSG